MLVTITTEGGCLAPLPLNCEGVGSSRSRSPRPDSEKDDLEAEAAELNHCDAVGNEYLPYSLTLIQGR